MGERTQKAIANDEEQTALSQRLDALADLSLYDLREQWRRLYRMQPPARLSRDLLTRGIAYRLQEQALGGVPKAVLRRLETTAARPTKAGCEGSPAPLVIKPGTRLVRQWRGVTHTVLVGTDHVEWNGQRYRSLSEVARAITGARWSGPRFFGLRARPASSTSGKRGSTGSMNTGDRSNGMVSAANTAADAGHAFAAGKTEPVSVSDRVSSDGPPAATGPTDQDTSPGSAADPPAAAINAQP